MPLDFRTVTSGRSSTVTPGASFSLPQNVLDNLAASATPIAPEPVARKRRDLRQEQIDRLIAAGDDPETAARVVDGMAQVQGGEIDPGLFDSYNTPEGNAALSDRISRGKAADARMGRFEANYNAETGHPEYGYDEDGNAARLGRVDINAKPSELQAARREARSYSYNAPHNSELESANNPMSDDRRAQISRDWARSVAAMEAKLAKSEAERLAQNEAEVEKYGRGNAQQITKDQAAARYERRVSEDRQRQNPAVVEARLRRMAARAGVSKEEARQMYEDGMAENNGGQTFDDFRQGTQKLRDMGDSRRLADEAARKEQWRATAVLAGGSHNINSGNRGIYNQASKLGTPKEQSEYLERMFSRNRGEGEQFRGDPRLQVAQMQIKANAEAEAKKQQFDAEQKALDRAAAATVGDTRAQQELQKMQVELEARRQEAAAERALREQQLAQAKEEADKRHEVLMQQNAAAQADSARRQEALMQQNSDARAEAERRHEAMMETSRQERLAAEARLASEERRHGDEMGLKGREFNAESELRQKAQDQLERERVLGPLATQHGEGVRHIAQGNYGTPEAQKSLQSIARESDQNWMGFWKDDAERMNELLKRLGVESADVRRGFVEKYGLAAGSGRGTHPSRWFHGTPTY
jgi:hypothetical protein